MKWVQASVVGVRITQSYSTNTRKTPPPKKKKIPKSQVIDQFAYIILACILS